MNRSRPFLHLTRSCRTASLVVMVFITILALALPASAGDQVPFKGRADDVGTSAQPEPDGLHFTDAATGQATHLGRFTRVGSGIIFPDGTFEGTLIWTAANGDQLFTDAEGASTSPTTVAGTYTITGGTGRFENASGEADFVGIASGGHFAVTFSGSISSPGASQK